MNFVVSVLIFVFWGLAGAYVGDKLISVVPSRWSDVALVAPIACLLVVGAIVMQSCRRQLTK